MGRGVGLGVGSRVGRGVGCGVVGCGVGGGLGTVGPGVGRYVICCEGPRFCCWPPPAPPPEFFDNIWFTEPALRNFSSMSSSMDLSQLSSTAEIGASV